jgi:hypothetical protein
MKQTLFLLSILTTFVASAQSIEISPNGGTNASAILDLKSTTKGFLLPRMTNAQMLAIPSPAQGLLAFCTDCGTNGDYYFYKGTAWVALGSVTVSVSTTVGPVSANANENGATITNVGVLNLAPANATNPGIVTTGAQTIAGVKTFSNGIIGNVTGNAATVTTNANLTGVVTSTGNVTSIANGAITNTMLANGAVANLSGTNTGDQILPTLSSLGAVASNSAITGATNTKITYDAKGLVTAGTAATTADIATSTNKNYVTDAQQTVINNTSGTNTGDQTLPTLSSLGAVASNSAITGATNTKITYDAKGLVTAGTAATTADIAASTNKNYVTDAQQTVINNTSGTNTGDQTLPTLSSLGAVASNSAITGATNTKITYDAKGLVTAGTAATTADIAASTNKNYVTDAQQTVINNTSGTNTGDQILPTLSSLGAVASNSAITGATNTKITYDAKGLVTAGAAATTADIAASTNKNYVTDAQQIVINNTSGTNTGDQTLPTLSSLGAVASNSAITGATNTKITYDAKGLVTAGAAATTADIAASTNKNYVTDAQQIVINNTSGTNTGDQTLPTLSSLGAVASNTAITGATNTKITYDAKGLVTAGAAATTADIAASTNKNYVTDAQQIVINNTSGTNTGDQTLPTLSSLGAVASNTAITGSTNTKITYDSKGLVTAGTAATTADIAASTNKNYVTDAQQTLINNTSGTNTGDQTLPTLSSLGAVASNTAITGSTNTKITYDSKGLVTAGTAATTADIAASTNKNYVTDAQQTVINNTSGTNTGDNAVNSLYRGLVSNATHTGDVIGSIALTIANDAVTTAKIADGAITDSKVTNVAASKITGTLAVANGGTGTTNGSITGTGALTFAAGGTNQNISITPSGTGSVGIGTSSPTTTAALDVTSTTKGFLPPRMTYAQRQAISSPPATGLIVYCTNCGINGGEPQFYNGIGWVNMIGGAALLPIPTVAATTEATNITGSTATSGGNITGDGGSVITARGVCWSTSQNPTIADSKTTDAGTTGIYTSNITGLAALTTYYVRAYATNAGGTVYGTQISFTSTLGIGSSYQGGIVYYIFQLNDPGYVEGQVHGLIVSPNGQGSATWNNNQGYFIGKTSTALGTGMANTNAIIAFPGSGVCAASIARSYQGGGYTDWYLPSKDEMQLLNPTLSSFIELYHFTSSEANLPNAYGWYPSGLSGISNWIQKNPSYQVRAIRTF